MSSYHSAIKPRTLLNMTIYKCGSHSYILKNHIFFTSMGGTALPKIASMSGPSLHFNASMGGYPNFKVPSPGTSYVLMEQPKVVSEEINT